MRELGRCDGGRRARVFTVFYAFIIRVDSNTIMKRATLIFGGLLFCVSPLESNLLSTSASFAMAQAVAAGTADVAALVKALSGENATERWHAAMDLGELGPAAKPALPALLNALKDKHAAVRQHAAVAIGDIGINNPRVVEQLVHAVGDDDPRVRVAAANSIRELVSDPAVLIPMAVEMMEKEDPLFAARIVETIVMRGEKAIPFLLEALKNERAAYWACLAIEEMGETAGPTVPAIAQLLDRGPDDSLKLQALLALAKIGPSAAAAKKQILAALGSDSSDTVLTGAAFAAGVMGFREAVPRLEQTKGSDEPLLAMVSLWALAKLHPDDKVRLQTAVDHLVGGLGSDDATIRLAAAEGLQELPLDAVTLGPKLIELLSDADPVVAYNLAETFASLGEPAAQRAGNALSNEKLRDLAVQVLERLGPKAKPAVPQIVAELAKAEGDYRQQLQSIVRQIGPDAAAATAQLVQSLDSDDEAIRIGALLAIGNIGPAAAAAQSKSLMLMDGSDSPFERIVVAWTVAKIASSDSDAVAKVIPVLITGLSFPDGRVQAEAASTLGSLGPAARSAAVALDALAAKEAAPMELQEIAKEAASAVR